MVKFPEGRTWATAIGSGILKICEKPDIWHMCAFDIVRSMDVESSFNSTDVGVLEVCNGVLESSRLLRLTLKGPSRNLPFFILVQEMLDICESAYPFFSANMPLVFRLTVYSTVSLLFCCRLIFPSFWPHILLVFWVFCRTDIS